MVKTVILSPHLDDAVFNCWHTLNQPNVTLLTVFAGIPLAGTSGVWDKLCGEPHSDMMVKRRRAENKQALDGLGVSIQYLNFLDAQYRTIALTADNVLTEIINATSLQSVFLVPLAASSLRRHVDHVLLRKVGIMLHQLGRRVIFYPDIPYMSLPKHISDASLGRLLSQSSRVTGLNLGYRVLQLSDTQQQAKRQAMRTYTSQYNMTNLISFGGLHRATKRNYELLLEQII